MEILPTRQSKLMFLRYKSVSDRAALVKTYKEAFTFGKQARSVDDNVVDS